MPVSNLTLFGSYGLRGKEIIYWSLIALFDLSVEQKISMVPAFDFIHHVLISEATILLIQEDLDVGREQAIEIKDLSSSYGIMAYPTDDDLDFRRVQATVRNLRLIAGAHDSVLGDGNEVVDNYEVI